MTAGRPRKGSGAPGRGYGLVLAPGASAGPDQPALIAIDRAASALGVKVARVALPKGKAERAVPRATEQVKALGLPDGKVFSGGRSFGGRVFSMAVADGLPAAGLVLLSYPLHPPGKPDQLRTDHFGQLKVPCLFVSGTRDAFGTPEELERAVALIPGPVTQVWVDGGDHGMRGKDDVVAEAVVGWLSDNTNA